MSSHNYYDLSYDEAVKHIDLSVAKHTQNKGYANLYDIMKDTGLSGDYVHEIMHAAVIYSEYNNNGKVIIYSGPPEHKYRMTNNPKHILEAWSTINGRPASARTRNTRAGVEIDALPAIGFDDAHVLGSYYKKLGKGPEFDLELRQKMNHAFNDIKKFR